MHLAPQVLRARGEGIPHAVVHMYTCVFFFLTYVRLYTHKHIGIPESTHPDTHGEHTATHASSMNKAARVYLLLHQRHVEEVC
jgi:hypothetical protein